jgi:osmotically-inducible protein OsmY
MKSKNAFLTAVAAAAFTLTLAGCDADHDRMPGVGAEGRDPATAERGYAAGGEASDDEITRRVRQALASDAQARDVEVSTEDGVVTLRGPVPSEQQRAQIESMARSAGATRIDNELEIESDATGERG